MKFTQRELQAPPAARPAPGIDDATTPSKVIRAPSACVIDFFEPRDRLPAGFEESSNGFEIKRMASKVTNRRISSIGRIDRIEESLYWLLSAATIVYLFLGLIGL
jgi:hypothetical protein